jgi:hypothetical protein
MVRKFLLGFGLPKEYLLPFRTILQFTKRCVGG